MGEHKGRAQQGRREKAQAAREKREKPKIPKGKRGQTEASARNYGKSALGAAAAQLKSYAKKDNANVAGEKPLSPFTCALPRWWFFCFSLPLADVPSCETRAWSDHQNRSACGRNDAYLWRDSAGSASAGSREKKKKKKDQHSALQSSPPAQRCQTSQKRKGAWEERCTAASAG